MRPITQRLGVGQPEAYPHEFYQGEPCPIKRQFDVMGKWIETTHTCLRCQQIREDNPHPTPSGYVDEPRRILRIIPE